MRNDKLAVVQHIVADQTIQKRSDTGRELRRLRRHLLQRFVQPVRDLHCFSRQLSQELGVVIARHADGLARFRHIHHQPQYVRRARAAINVVSHKDRFAAGRGNDCELAVGLRDGISQSREQCLKLIEAPVDVADDVERAVFVLLVVPKRFALDRQRLDLLQAV